MAASSLHGIWNVCNASAAARGGTGRPRGASCVGWARGALARAGDEAGGEPAESHLSQRRTVRRTQLSYMAREALRTSLLSGILLAQHALISHDNIGPRLPLGGLLLRAAHSCLVHEKGRWRWDTRRRALGARHSRLRVKVQAVASEVRP